MRLFSRICGTGNPIIILHGLFGMSDNWNSIGKKLSYHFQVHILDLRNHGRSPHDDDFNYDVMCADLLEYIQEHKIKKPILLGHSLGGKVAMKCAFTYPEIIERLIVADISPRRYKIDFVQNLLQLLHNMPLENFNKREEIDNMLSLTYKDKDIRQFLLKNLYRKKDKGFTWRFNIDILLEKVSNIQEADFINGVCNVPTHFIRGGDSNYITTEDEIIINKHFSDFSITTIERAGHWLHAENPVDFYNIVFEFIKEK